MLAHQIVNLSNRVSWNLNLLLAESWPKSVFPRSSTRARFQELWPTRRVGSKLSFSVMNGETLKAVKSYSGASFLVGEGEDSPSVGDLIISTFSGKAILVTSELIGLHFTRNHVVLRGSRRDTISLWAFLNSKTGNRLLVHVKDGCGFVSLRLNEIEDLGMLELDEKTSSYLHARAVSTDFHTDEMCEESVQESWWRTKDLSHAPWDLSVALPNTEDLLRGTKLSDLASIRLGRFINRDAIVSKSEACVIPFANRNYIETGILNEWVAMAALESGHTKVETGCLVVAAMTSGLSARVVSSPMVIGHHAAILEAREGSDLQGIGNYLNSVEAKSKWRIMTQFRHLSQVTVAGLSSLTLSKPLSDYPDPDTDQTSIRELSIFLEEVLWAHK